MERIISTLKSKRVRIFCVGRNLINSARLVSERCPDRAFAASVCRLMRTNATSRIANVDVFCEADAVMARIKKQLRSTTSMSLSEATSLVKGEGNEMLRALLQEYLQQCRFW